MTKTYTDWFNENETLIEETLMQKDPNDIAVLSVRNRNHEIEHQFTIVKEPDEFEVDDDYDFSILLPNNDISFEVALNSWKHTILTELHYHEEELKARKEELRKQNQTKTTEDYAKIIKDILDNAVANDLRNEKLIKDISFSDYVWSHCIQNNLFDENSVEIYTDRVQTAIKAQKFIDKLPLYEETIANNHYTGEESFIRFNQFNKAYEFASNNVRVLFSMEGNDNGSLQLPEYDEAYDDIHLNVLEIHPKRVFGVAGKFNLDSVQEKVDVFHYTKSDWSTTYYATDDQLIALLEALDEWIEDNRPEADEVRRLYRMNYTPNKFGGF